MTLHSPRVLSRRHLIALSGGVAATAGLAACGAGSTTATSPGTAGTTGGAGGTLSIVVEAGGKGELTPIAEAFQTERGVTVSFIELPYDGLFERVQSELSSGSPSFDLAALDAVWLSTFAGALTPLDDLFTAEVQDDLFPALLEEAQVQGHFVGMPAWTNAEILFYRTDLFEDEANKTAFQAEYGYELTPPATWDQFTDVARFFTRDGLYGTDVKGAVETEWLAHVLQAGSDGVVLDADGAVIIDNQAHADALAFYANLATEYNVCPPGAAQVDWAGAQNLFHQGQTAMMRFWAHAFPMIPDDATVKGSVGVAPMIAGSAGIAGIPGPWYLSVPTASPQSELALEFVQFAYDNNVLSVESELGLAARKSAFAEYADREGYEHFEALLTTLEAPATAPRPATPRWQQITDSVLIPTLQKAVVPGADYTALLTQAKADVERIVG